MNKKVLIFALALPIVILLAVTFHKFTKVTWGTEYVIPIAGFDPRDLLSGHYLTYRIKYAEDMSDFCSGEDYNNSEAYLCLKKESGEYNSDLYYYESDLDDDDCMAVIRGRCQYGRFTADIERFYIPEERAELLDRLVRHGSGKIVLSITAGGNASVKDLLIDDKSWKEYVDGRSDERWEKN